MVGSIAGSLGTTTTRERGENEELKDTESEDPLSPNCLCVLSFFSILLASFNHCYIFFLFKTYLEIKFPSFSSGQASEKSICWGCCLSQRR